MKYNLNNEIAKRQTKSVYRDGDKTIKLFIENYSKANILNEALIQARVEEMAKAQNKPAPDVKKNMGARQLDYIKNDIIIKKLCAAEPTSRARDGDLREVRLQADDVERHVLPSRLQNK